MKKILLFISLALALSACKKEPSPTYISYPLAILINEGGYESEIDMLAFNEKDLVLEDNTLRSSNDAVPRGEFHGLFMDGSGASYALLSNQDRLVQLDLARFKLLENNILSDLAQPTAMSISGYYLFVLNNGKVTSDTSSAYISVYAAADNYALKLKHKVNKGSNDIFVDDTYIYVAGPTGIEVYDVQTFIHIKTVPTPTAPKRFLVEPNSHITVSCPGYGLCNFDFNTLVIIDSLEVPVGASGKMAIGRDNSEIYTYTDTGVYISSIPSQHYEQVYAGTGITGVGRSTSTHYTYISTEGGTKQLVFDDKRELLKEISTPSGGYTYLYSTRIIYE